MNDQAPFDWLKAWQAPELPRQPLGLLAVGIFTSSILSAWAPAWLSLPGVVALGLGLGALYLRHWWAIRGRWLRDKRALQATLGQLRLEYVQAQAQHTHLHTALEKLRQASTALDKKLAEDQRRYTALEKKLRPRQAEVATQEEYLKNVTAALARQHTEYAAMEAQLVALRTAYTQQNTTLRQDQTRLKAELMQAQAQLKAELAQEKERLEHAVQEQQATLATLEQTATTLGSELQTLKYLQSEAHKPEAKSAAAPLNEWTVRFSHDFVKTVLDRADKVVQGRILEAVLQVYREPLVSRGDTVKPLTHLKGQWRYRASNFRLIFAPLALTRVIEFSKLEQRGEAYRDH